MNAKKLAMHMAITGAIVLITSESAQATYPGANGMIGYSYSQGPYDYGSGPTRTVQAIQPDGTGAKNLLKDFYTFCFLSSWSADGKYFVWTKRVGYDGIEIWMSAVDGSSSIKVFNSTGRGNVPWASISPDAKKIVFDPGGGTTMYIADVESHASRQLINNPGEWIGEPGWSPDGRLIAYQRSGDIWVMNSDGTNQKKLTAGGGSPDWSPDGTKILFSGYRSNPAGIWVVNSDGSNRKFISPEGGASWSPDGTKIVFDCDRQAGNLSPGICVANSDGSNKILFAPQENAGNAAYMRPRWQPIPYTSPLLHVLPISPTNLQLSWNKTPNAQSYRLQRKTGDCSPADIWETRVDVNPDTTSFGEDSGLQPNTTYSYQIASYYGSGSFSNYSACVSAKTSAAGVPNMPSSLKWAYPDRTMAQSQSASEVLLGWDDDSADETGFAIYRKAGAEAWAQIDTVPANTQGYTDVGAAGNTGATGYAYDVRACNAAGCSPLNPKPSVVPFAPTKLAAVVGSAVNLAWQDNSGNETGFEVSRKNGACNAATPWTVVGKPTADSQSYADGGAVAKTVYAYRVRAVYDSGSAPRSLGYSGYSNCVSVTAP